MRKSTLLSTILLLAGCAPSGGASPPPPPAAADHPACILSADCAAGTYCDLGECIQSCNTTDPCTGEQTCTPRGRCAPAGQADADPTPTPQHAGAVQATPASVVLTGDVKTFSITLTSTSQSPVRYRVQLDAPHLSIDAPRGEFTGKTTLTLKVDGSKLKGHSVPGSVKVFTTLGNAIVDAPIRVGVTGSYRGAMRYDGGPVPLGDVHVGLDLIEQNGNLFARIDSKSSLLFPSQASGEITGKGLSDATSGLDFTVAQVLDPAFGGARNHFQRAIGRKVRFQLKPTDRGGLAGTFTETIVGLFSEPVSTTGKVALEYRPADQDPNFTVGADIAMPPSPSKTASLTPDKVFGWNGGAQCDYAIGCNLRECPPGDPNCDCNDGVTQCSFVPCDTGSLTSAQTTYAKPLNQSMVNRSTLSSAPFDTLATACGFAMNTKSFGDYQALPPAEKACGLLVPVACALETAAGVPVSDKTTATIAGQLVAETAAPALLVAKNELVAALNGSFAESASAEITHYDNALGALGPVTTWLVQPRVLEYLHSMDPSAAKGADPQNTQTQNDTYPAARALADLFATLGSVDGQRSHAQALASAGSQTNAAADAQAHAVLGFLEAATLSEILSQWRTVPTTVGARFLGVLSPSDAGFRALLEGTNVFGVPDGYVPFVYRPEDIGKGATNFEQVLATATPLVSTEKELEGKFVEDKRICDQNQSNLQNELGGVRDKYDLRLIDMCGAGFNRDTDMPDWTACGCGPSYKPTDNVPNAAACAGEVGAAQLAIAQAYQQLQAAENRGKGLADKIAIDKRVLAQTLNLDESLIAFTKSTGEQLEINAFGRGVLDAESQAMSTAAQASLWDAGAALGDAACVLLIGVEKAALDAQRQELETAQQVQADRISEQKDYVNGMANIQKEMIDHAQLSVEMHQQVIGLLQAELAARNTLANAKAVWDERQRALALVAKEPSNDPSYRLTRDELAIETLKARDDAQKQLYLAGKALEYELNMSVGPLDGAVANANNGARLDALSSCMLNVYNQARIAYGTPQDYSATVSVRQMLGISGPRADKVTGQTLSAGEQFRQLLLRNENLDGRGGVGITFATDLQPGNQLWSTDVCADRISTVQAQLVGDFLGDNQAQVNIQVSGGSVMRACDSSDLRNWSLGGDKGSAFAVVQSGVNGFGDAPPNTSLFGQSVARASWVVVIPGGQDAPPNADVDLTHVDDIVLKFGHKAMPRKGSPLSIDFSCFQR